MTYDELIKKYGIKFSVHSVRERPDGWEHPAYHFRCRISSGRNSFGLYFSKGTGLGASLPEFAEVLDCLASDAAGYENAGSFEEWASEYGYDIDSRKAEKIYRTVKRQAEQLKRVLGAEAYDDLLWHTERA